MAATPQWIGRYRVHEVIGTGGFAIVYRARDDHLSVDVAIKVLAENHSLDPEVRQRFIEEGRRLRRVRSAHVVGVHDLDDTERAQPYLVLDWADRGDLAARVAGARTRGRPPRPADALAVAGAVASALAVLHRHRLVHRDLAPGNLLLCSTGPPAGLGDPESLIGPDEQRMGADHGLSKDLAGASGLTQATGTSGFAPPEQRKLGGTVDHRADIWATSALILWLATDHPPDDEGRWPHRLRDVRWPPDVGRVLARGLAERPDDRYPDIGAWRAALDAALRPRPPVPLAGTTRVAGRGGPGRRILPLLLLVSLLTGGAIGAAATGGRADHPAGRNEQLGDGRRSTVVRDHGITVTVTGAPTAAVGETVRLEATVDGSGTWQWIGPDGVLYQGEDTIELTPRSAGRATVRLQAFDEQGRSVTASHRLDVTEEPTTRQ
jgi:hypothetical protein